MISYILNTSIFNIPAHIMINPVNCQGVMGAGLALEFKNRYPEMFQEYKEACAAGHLQPGECWTWSNPDVVIINVATKYDWRELSKHKWVKKGLKHLNRLIRVYRNFGWQDQIKVNPLKVSIPALGCGCGMLEWSEVRKMIDEELNEFFFDKEVEINVFPPIDKKLKW